MVRAVVLSPPLAPNPLSGTPPELLSSDPDLVAPCLPGVLHAPALLRPVRLSARHPEPAGPELPGADRQRPPLALQQPGARQVPQPARGRRQGDPTEPERSHRPKQLPRVLQVGAKWLLLLCLIR